MPDGFALDLQPTDAFFGPAYIAVDEWRESPVRYRYIQGGFAGTDTKFSFYLPPPERYAGRMLHYVEAGAGGHHTTVLYDGQDGFPWVRHLADIDHAFSCGAILIESNQGHVGDMKGLKGDRSILIWRASAETARFAKRIAAHVYGAAPHHSYLFGACGGAQRCLTCLSEAPELWDGLVPYTISGPSQTLFSSMQANAVRALSADEMCRINDALEVGGSGNPFESLSSPAAEALALLYRCGFPRGVTFDCVAEQVRVWSAVARQFPTIDPTYFQDFWTKPGYAGHDRPDLFADSLVETTATVTRVLTSGAILEYRPESRTTDRFGVGEDVRLAAGLAHMSRDKPLGIAVDCDGLERMGCARVALTSGAANGRENQIQGVVGNVLVANPGARVFEDVAPGDTVSIDNRNFIAWCHYHRHVHNAELPDWNTVDGAPIYPRRPVAHFHKPFQFKLDGKKIIVLQNMADSGNWPCNGVTFRDNLRAALGIDPAEVMRLWFFENGHHFQGSMAKNMDSFPAPTTRMIDYEGALHQAIRDLIAWVEFDKAPPADSKFDYVERAVKLATCPEERGGIQPVVRVTANGAARAQVAVGEVVEFAAEVEVPPGAGTIIAAEWDFDGLGTWPVRHPEIDGTSSKLRLVVTHSFAEAGTLYPAVRVSSHREGVLKPVHGDIVNLGRVRVVVTPR